MSKGINVLKKIATIRSALGVISNTLESLLEDDNLDGFNLDQYYKDEFRNLAKQVIKGVLALDAPLEQMEDYITY
jgi:hypothetical protein